MVLFDVAEVVEVVDHDAEALLAPALGKIAGPVEALQPRAVAEVEARSDRVERQSSGVAGGHEIGRHGAEHRLAHLLDARRIVPPFGGIEPGERGAVGRGQRGSGLGALARQPVGEIRRRRQGHEGREPRHFAAYLGDHLFDEEAAEGHAGEAALAVGDRIEHRRVGALGIERLALRGSRIGAIASGISRVSATSTKINGSSTSAG